MAKTCRAIIAGAAFFATLLAGQTARANLITNGSFELGDYPYGNFGEAPVAGLPAGSTTIPGWTATAGSDILVVTAGYYDTAQDGSNLLDLTGYQNAAPYGGVTQSITTSVGAEYNLTFWVGVANNVAGTYHNGPVSVNASAGSTSLEFTNASTADGNQWQQFTLPFTAASTTTSISIVGTNAAARYLGLDNVSVDAVPEPMTASLLAIGCLGLLIRRRSSC